MPARERSLRITDAYRARRGQLIDQAGAATRRAWLELVEIADLDATTPAWIDRTTTQLTVVQAAVVRLTAAYLEAYMRSEVNRPVDPVRLDEANYIGKTRSGAPMANTLAGVPIKTKVAIRDGIAPTEAFTRAGRHASQLVAAEAVHASRTALATGIRDDARIVGWQRVTSGGCGACLGAATRTYGDTEPLQVHDGCRCSQEPIVAGVQQRVPRPGGPEIFDAMDHATQDATLGPEKADLVRRGDIALHQLVATTPMVAIADQITEAPLAALT